MCGIAACYDIKNTIQDLLIYLQNRGQESYGYAWVKDGTIKTEKNTGFVQPPSEDYATTIGHVRYRTSGELGANQPVFIYHPNPDYSFAFAFNGHIRNHSEVQYILLNDYNYVLPNCGDTDSFGHLLFGLRQKYCWKNVFKKLSKIVDGAWSLVILTRRGTIILARDPHGYRPLSVGRKLSCWAAASESSALTNAGFNNIVDVKPGCCIIWKEGQEEKHQFCTPKKSLCFFEHVYFSNIASEIDNISVYKVRANLGKKLAELEMCNDNKGYIVVPVPDTARASADAFAHKLNLPCREGLIRNRYVGRIFIEKVDRALKAKRKYTVLPGILSGKKIFLIDDSVVRGTTMRVITAQLRQAGVTEIHLRVACPEIKNPCYYGIDIGESSELFSYNYSETQEQEAELGVDSIRFVKPGDIKHILGHKICMGCVNGKYCAQEKE